MEYSRRSVRGLWAGALFLVAALPALAGPADLKELDATIFKRLQARASQHTDVTLDGAVLKMGAAFIASGNDEDSAKLRRLVGGLTSVTIRNFEFKKPGDYTSADLDAIRSQIKLSEWKRIVNTANKENNESSEVYILPGKEKPQGLFVITAEPLELTVVHILGAVDPKDITTLEHLHMGDDQEDK